MYPVLPASASFATYHNPGYGPTFGEGHDLHITDNCNLNTNSFAKGFSYPLPNYNTGGDWMLGSYIFRVSEIEVFLVG